MNINIIDNKFNSLGIVDEFESLIMTKKYHGIGSFELHLHTKNNGAKHLQKENIIYTRKDKAFIILYRKASTLDRSLVVRGLELKSYLARWLVFPPEGESHFKATERAGNIMVYFMLSTILRLELFPTITYGPGNDIGPVMTYQTRYKYLAEVLETISKASGVGWDIVLDLNRKRFQFLVYEGINRVSSQTTNPRAVFSVEYDNVKDQELIESRLDYANMAIVAGQGEGVNRQIMPVGEYTNALEAYEIFVDARDINDMPALSARGKAELAKRKEIIVFDSDVIADSNLVYEEDYNLGDLVTNENKEWNIVIDRRITGITEIYEKDGFRLDIDFGEGPPGVIDVIKRLTNDLVE